jgi:hypothetical protein
MLDLFGQFKTCYDEGNLNDWRMFNLACKWESLSIVGFMLPKVKEHPLFSRTCFDCIDNHNYRALKLLIEHNSDEFRFAHGLGSFCQEQLLKVGTNYKLLDKRARLLYLRKMARQRLIYFLPICRDVANRIGDYLTFEDSDYKY